MQRVPDKLYVWLNTFATVLGGLLFVGALAGWFISQLAFLRTDFGFTPIIAAVGAAQMAYGLLLFKKRWSDNPWTAGLFSGMLLSLNLVSLMHNSGQLHSPFVVAWFLIILFSGMFGLYAAVGYSFFITTYYILFTTSAEGQDLIDPIGLGVVGTTYFLAFISYQLWKRLYLDQESAKIKQLSGQLSSSQAQAEILIQSISDGIVVTDAEGKITLLNPSAATMTGWTINDAIGLDSKLVIKLQMENGSEIEQAQNPYQILATTLKPATALVRLVSKTDSFMTVSLSVSPILGRDGKTMAGSVAVIRDVSDARAEENRRADFISTASHEMRTPVAAVEGYLQLALNEKVSKIDAKARDYLTKALDSTHHLGKLFQDLLTSAKAEDGRLVSHPKVVEIGELLQKITDDLRFSAEKKGLMLDFRIGATAAEAANTAGGKVLKPLYYVYADDERLREVMTNLFDNAVKYSDKGTITIALTGNNDVVQFFIKDMGIGIPKEDIPHLFQKFYRVDSSATRTIGGSGLGLFICKRIVELYKGRIWVESEKGKGSTFYINLPRLSNQKAAELLQKQAQALA